MMNGFKIEKGIPAPDRHGGRGNPRFPFHDMEVGDSFLVPLGEAPHKVRSVLSNAIAVFHLRNKPKRLTSKTTDDGIRVWRTA